MNRKRHEMTAAKFRKGARVQRRQNANNPTKHDRLFVVMKNFNRHQDQARMKEPEARVTDLEVANASSSLPHTTAESPTTEKTEPETESTLSWFCRTHGIRTFPKDPAKELRGLLSEFNIEESAVDVVRDIRDNP